jgi:hypothetical protein
MRFMVIVKANKDSEAGVLPDEKQLKAMMKYNEELAKAGVLLAGEGLQASSKGARVRFAGDKRTVVPGPFPETKDLIAGFWISKSSQRMPLNGSNAFPSLKVKSKIRQIFEADDFGPALTPELREQEERLRAQEPINR